MSPALYDERVWIASKSSELELEALAREHAVHEVNLFLLYSGLGKPQSVATPLAAGAEEGLPELPGHGDEVPLLEPGHGSVWGTCMVAIHIYIYSIYIYSTILQNILQPNL